MMHRSLAGRQAEAVGTQLKRGDGSMKLPTDDWPGRPAGLIARGMLACFIAFAALVDTGWSAELEAIQSLDATLRSSGLSGLLRRVREDREPCPSICSRWKLDREVDAGRKATHLAAREFGKRLAEALDIEARKLQESPATEASVERVEFLLSVAAFSGSTTGYGNLFLAARAVDLASVAMAQTAVRMDVPIARLVELSPRLSPKYLAIESCVAVLNGEVGKTRAGVTLFQAENREALEAEWISGLRHWRLANPRTGLLPFPIPILATRYAAAGDFFVDTEATLHGSTLTGRWEDKDHRAFVAGLDRMSTHKAQALIEFRRVVGEFPERPIFTPEELRNREEGRVKAEKAGLKVVTMESTYSNLRAAGFAWAWRKALRSSGVEIARLPTVRQNLDSLAYLAFDEVARGQFYDRDTAAVLLERRKPARAGPPPPGPQSPDQ